MATVRERTAQSINRMLLVNILYGFESMTLVLFQVIAFFVLWKK